MSPKNSSGIASIMTYSKACCTQAEEPIVWFLATAIYTSLCVICFDLDVFLPIPESSLTLASPTIVSHYYLLNL